MQTSKEQIDLAAAEPASAFAFGMYDGGVVWAESRTQGKLFCECTMNTEHKRWEAGNKLSYAEVQTRAVRSRNAGQFMRKINELVRVDGGDPGAKK